MLNFKTFVLLESLENPIEFYMTDDTDIPRRIVASFNIDDEQYGMSIEETNFDRIYQLDFYRIANVNKKYWGIRKPKHIRQIFATLFKFAEASLPFIKMRMDGVILRIPGKYSTPKFNKLAELLIKRVYVKTFRYVPVEQKAKQPYNFLFFIKKNKQPESIFKSKQFKNYEFDPNDKVLPFDTADEIEPKRIQKKTASLKPAKKYSFKGLNVPLEVELGDDIYEKLISMKPNNTKKNPIEIKIENLVKSISRFEYLLIGFPDMLSMAKFKQEKYDSLNSTTFDILVYTKKKSYKKLLIDANILDSETSNIRTPLQKSKFNNFLKRIKEYAKNISKSEINSLKTKYEKIYDSLPEDIEFPEEDNSKDMITLDSEISPNQLTAGVVGGEKMKFNFGKSPYKLVSNYDYQETKKYLSETKKYEKQIMDLQEDISSAIFDYTGPKYMDVNPFMRDFANNVLDEDINDENIVKEFSNHRYNLMSVLNITNSLKDLEPLDKPLWVFRGMKNFKELDKILLPGNDYVDPAVLSTSLDPNINFGGDIKMCIYVPKGSKIIPVLSYSNHPTEEEIILPPMSVLKIIKVDNIKKTEIKVVYAIYMGTAIKSFFGLQKVKNLIKSISKTDSTFKNMKLMIEQKLKKKYNPNNKFGGKGADPKTSEKLAKLFKKELKRKSK